MKPEWFIQTNMDGVDTKPMIDEVIAQGMDVRRIEHTLGHACNFGEYEPNDCIICYGDIDFVRQVITNAPFIPGVYCNFKNMKCSIYYGYLGEHLLNQQYIMMPAGDLLRQWDNIISTWNTEGLFIRPDSGAKPFTGYIVVSNDSHKIESLIQAIGSEMLVVVSPEKPIETEWRFVICDGKVVTGCQYLPTENSTLPPPSSFRLAGKIASKEWQPDLCYTVDICESEGKMYLLEINSLSCAGLYGCDLKPIIEHVSRIAEEEWKDYCDPRTTS
jgi:hypothetical protein